jgi:hypothetical protein
VSGLRLLRGGSGNEAARLSRPLAGAVVDVISEALDEDPKEVARALAAAVDRCKADGRYAMEELEAAAEQLCRELGITCEWQAIRSRGSAGLH